MVLFRYNKHVLSLKSCGDYGLHRVLYPFSQLYFNHPAVAKAPVLQCVRSLKGAAWFSNSQAAACSPINLLSATSSSSIFSAAFMYDSITSSFDSLHSCMRVVRACDAANRLTAVVRDAEIKFVGTFKES